MFSVLCHHLGRKPLSCVQCLKHDLGEVVFRIVLHFHYKGNSSRIHIAVLYFEILKLSQMFYQYYTYLSIFYSI